MAPSFTAQHKLSPIIELKPVLPTPEDSTIVGWFDRHLLSLLHKRNISSSILKYIYVVSIVFVASKSVSEHACVGL